jgi:N-acetyl-anhydromuramyl-L-alanine amidase AmpD
MFNAGRNVGVLHARSYLYKMKVLDKSKDIEVVSFPLTQYIQEETYKFQIYLHHTAGNSDAAGVFQYWSTNQERVATHVAIAGKPGKNDTFTDGQIVQGYPSKYWAYHLGLRESTFHKFNLPYKSLDRLAIGIEVCCWGQLAYKDGKHYNVANKVVAETDVIELSTPFRGFKYFHNYTDAQIDSVEKLLRYWGSKYNIPLTYKEDIWDVCPRALSGASGVFTHNSVRYDKVDIYPHPKMIEMLKSL